ncbi:ribosome hibernation-promoting factor, HPF/YfiA family [Rhodobaculum claviforme]|uniref:Ribosome hibernation promoting factor n=1 Tax=Rhodobaculum claviforme TaxID=1549854 RepID=A0A934TMZ0_9RHOB|nr:ribosome-associated translation inhibitor RaiA [Rhodobaculum claviforme]MBK5928780.1 ribosomal subunit interface protein [Rhodobaculum claviforme]
MGTQISGKQIDIGSALQTHVTDGLAAVMEKYAQTPTDATVVFSRDAHMYVCETLVHLPSGLTAQARGQASEVYAAFEACRDKMEKQLRRYKRRLKDHHRVRSQPVEFGGGAGYVLAGSEGEDTPEPEGLQPIIIAEMEMRIPKLSAGEAVMQMELAESPVLVFRNERHGGVNVVYRRDDGNIGWIDPQETA